MAAAEDTTRSAVVRKREKARAIRAERAALATAAWKASGRAPGIGKGMKAAALGDDVLTPGEVRDLLNACGTSTTGIRNAAMLALLYGTAMRISEACGLQPSDLALAATSADTGALAAAMRIRARKGGKDGHVGINSEMVPYLVAWSERRKSLGLNGNDPYFCAISGDSLGNPTIASYWRHLLPRLAAKAGIEKRVHPHGLRRTAATHLRDNGAPLDVIQYQLGHANLSTSQVYLAGRASADHLRIVAAFGADVAPTAPPVADAHAGAVVSMEAAATANATALLVSLPADYRDRMSGEQVKGFIAGTVDAWLTAAARA